MLNRKFLVSILLAAFLLSGFVLPAFAVVYNPGVTVGEYVKYGNFAGAGLGVENFNDYDWLKLQVTEVSGEAVTLLSTSQYKNGTAIPGNGSISVWNVEAGTEDGLPSTQGPIIAANLNQGDAIPPPNTFSVNRTENRIYLGVSRIVCILDLTLSTSSYNSTITYVYDRKSGMLLEYATTTTTQAQPQPAITTISYSAIETNIFGTAQTSPSPTVPELPTQMMGFILLVTFVLVTCAFVFLKKKAK